MTGNLRIDILFQRVSGDKNVQSEPVNDLKDLHHKTEEFLPNVSGAAILVFQGYDHKLDRILHQIYPAYPPYLCKRTYEEIPKAPYIPASFHKHTDLALVHEFIRFFEKPNHTKRRRSRDIEKHSLSTPCRVLINRVGIWLCPSRLTDGVDRQASAKGHPVILLFKSEYHHSNDLMTCIMKWYNSEHNPHKFEALDYVPAFIFCSLNEMLNDWAHIMSIGEESCKAAEHDCYQPQSSYVNVMDRTRSHHEEITALTQLRPYLKRHQNAIRKLQQFYKFDIVEQTNRPTKVDQEEHRIHNHLIELKDGVDTWSDDLDKMLERYQNLTDLDFNIASATLDRSVAILTGLGFVFIPLGLLASILSLAESHARLKWFGFACLPVFFCSLVAWQLAARFEVMARLLPSRAGARYRLSVADYMPIESKTG